MIQALARRYRPKQFCEVVGQPHTVRALENALNPETSLKEQHVHHALLFTGTRGVGKTSIARIVAKCLSCEQTITHAPCQQCSHCQELDRGCFPDLLEIDAASRTKVEDTRDLLDSIIYPPIRGRYKILLIDEVHMLSTHSFNALLKTLEEPPPHVVFLLATTAAHRLPATILSRCLQFHLHPIPAALIDEQCQQILKQEQIKFEPAATHLLSEAADGSLRDALSLLDQAILHGGGQLCEADLRSILGVPDNTIIFNILQALHAHDASGLFTIVNHLAETASDFSKTLEMLIAVLHEIAVLQALPHSTAQDSSSNNTAIVTAASQFTPEDLQLYYQIALIGQRDLPLAPSARIGFEMTLLRMLDFIPHTSDTAPISAQQQPGTHQSPASTSSLAKTQASHVFQPSNTQQEPNSPKQATLTTHQNPSLDWKHLLSQLELDGAALALAQHCSQKQWLETGLILSLEPQLKPLLQDQYIERIASALTQYFKKPMSVQIDIDLDSAASKEETPAAFAKRKEANRMATLQKTVMADTTVQNIIQAFDAKVIKNSVSSRHKDENIQETVSSS